MAACVISGGCTYLLGRKLKTYNTSQQLVRYVAPAHALAAGAVLQPADLEWIEWPAKNPLVGSLTSEQGLAGRVVLYPIEKGQPLLERYMAAPGIGAGLGSRIPNGMRALALRSDEVVGVAGFLAPGSRLDVLVTYHTANNADEMTATVVQNAEVLAAGQQAEPDPTGKPAIATVVTLLLNPLDAERAVAASNQGTIHFVLRNTLDKGETANAPVSLSSLGGSSLGGSSLGGPGADASQVSGPRRESGPPPVSLTHARRRAGGTGVETVLGGDSDDGASGGAGKGAGSGSGGMAAASGSGLAPGLLSGRAASEQPRNNSDTLVAARLVATPIVRSQP